MGEREKVHARVALSGNHVQHDKLSASGCIHQTLVCVDHKRIHWVVADFPAKLQRAGNRIVGAKIQLPVMRARPRKHEPVNTCVLVVRVPTAIAVAFRVPVV